MAYFRNTAQSNFSDSVCGGMQEIIVPAAAAGYLGGTLADHRRQAFDSAGYRDPCTRDQYVWCADIPCSKMGILAAAGRFWDSHAPSVRMLYQILQRTQKQETPEQPGCDSMDAEIRPWRLLPGLYPAGCVHTLCVWPVFSEDCSSRARIQRSGVGAYFTA